MLQTLCIALTAVLAIVTVYLLVRAVQQMVAIVGQGQPISRTDNPGQRWTTMLKETFGHTRMFQWRWVGVMHWFVYFGFIILASAVATGLVQLLDPKWQLPIIGHWFVFEWVCEFIGLLSTIGIVFLIVYRQMHKPAQLGRQSRFYGSRFSQAYFVEFMALLEGAAILFIRGAEEKYALLVEPDKSSQSSHFHFPIAHLLGGLYGDSESALKNTILIIALIKVLSALVWLDVIALNLTMGIAWHRFTAWPNIWFKRESVGRSTDGATTALGRMKPMTIDGKPVTLDDVENDRISEDAVLGVGKIEDFAWKGILDFTTCTECGRCQSQCPAWNTEKPLSPKLLVMDLREQAYANAGTGLRTPVPELDVPYAKLAGAEEAPLVDFDVLWSCTSCGACVQQCPVDIEHVDHIMDMRRYQVLVESNFPAELNGLFRGLEGKGNPWNMAPTQRLDWAKDLDFDVPVVGEDLESLESVDWLFWVGCAGAYEDRAKKTTRAVAELLNIAGISFGVLGNGETCTGDPARRAGNEFVFQGLAQQNVETFKEFKVKKAVTTCAHCFNTLKNEYREFGIELEVVHHTQLLNKLVRDGKLTPVPSGAGAHKRSITYHDPCYIGRHNGVYTPPRELLEILPGAQFVEMERNSERSFCCGAGGARMWMEEKIGQRINRNRTDEAVGTGADQIATGCPFCRIMLSDGLTAAQADGTAREEVEVLDVAQMLLASVKGEQATKLLPGQSTGAAASPAQAERKTAEPGQDTDTSAPAAPAEETPVEVPDDASSLFDTPAPAEPAAPAEEPAEPEKAEEPEPAAEAESAAEPASAAPAASSGTASTPRTDVDIDALSSLFEIDAPEGAVAAGAAPAAPAPAAKEAPAEPEPTEEPATTEAPAEETAAKEEPVVEEPAATQAPAEKPTAPAPTAPAASSGTVSTPHTDLDLSSYDSLFDIPAPEGSVASAPAPAASSAPSAPAPETPAEEPAAKEAPAEQPATEEAPAEEAPAAETPSEEPTEAPAPAAPAASSGTSSTPHRDVDISTVESLFDIPAPEGGVAAAPAAKADPEPEAAQPEKTEQQESEPEATAEEAPSEPEAKEEPAEKAEPAPITSLKDIKARAAAASEAPAEPENAETAEPETAEEPPAEPKADPAAEKPKSSGATNEPRRDVDITSLDSLFDI